MGYGSTGRFLEHGNWMSVAGVSPPATICSLGDQTVSVPQPENLGAIKKFIEGYGGQYEPSKYEEMGNSFYVRHVYQDAGFQYISIDLNEKDGSLGIDLNHWPPSNLPAGQFDVLINQGTTEHCPNQINAFAIIHYLVRPGGLMIHNIPSLNYMAHAMVCATPYFFKKLIDSNNYQVISARLRHAEVRTSRAFHDNVDLHFIEGFREAIEQSTIAGMGDFALQKQSDSEFVPPIDVDADDDVAREVMRINIEHYRWP